MYWGWKKEAEFERTKPELLSELPDTVDEDSLLCTMSFGFGLFPVRFEWEIKPGSDAYRLVEECYISKGWYWLLSVAIIGIAGGFIGFQHPDPIVSAVSLGVVFLGLLLLNGLFIGLARLESPVAKFYRTGRNKKEFLPVASLVLGFFTLLLALILTEGRVQLAAFGAILIWLAAFHLYHTRIAKYSFRWQSRLVQRTKQFPLIASNYVVMLVLASIALSMFLFTYQNPLFTGLTVHFPIIFPLTFSLLQLGAIAIGLINLREGWRSETSRFRRQGRNITQGRSVFATGFIVISMSAVFAVLSYHVVQGGIQLARTFDSIGVYWLLFVTTLPIGFIGAGFCYQVVSVGRNLFGMYREAEKRDLSEILEVDAKTYVLDYDGVFAGAVSLLDDYILISKGVLEELDDDDIAAVLAHEEGHIEYGETRITLLIAFLSPLVLTGKNILYGILDFRAREYRADEYAVSRLGDRQQVLDALDSLQEVKTTSLGDRFGGVTPTLVPMDAEDNDATVLTRLFGFYFGNFAFSQAHPSLEERRDELRR